MDWEEETKKDAREWAKRFNSMGLVSEEMDSFLKELSTYWINESQEWREAFIRATKADKIVFLIDIWMTI